MRAARCARGALGPCARPGLRGRLSHVKISVNLYVTPYALGYAYDVPSEIVRWWYDRAVVKTKFCLSLTQFCSLSLTRRCRERAQAFFDGLPAKVSPLNDAFFFSTFFLGAAFLIALPEACALCGLPLAALALIFLFLSNAGMPILETLAERPIITAGSTGSASRQRETQRDELSKSSSSAVRAGDGKRADNWENNSSCLI